MPNQFYYIPDWNSCINVKENDKTMETQQPIIMRMRGRAQAHTHTQNHVLIFVTRRTIIDILDFSCTSDSMKTHQRHSMCAGRWQQSEEMRIQLSSIFLIILKAKDISLLNSNNQQRKQNEKWFDNNDDQVWEESFFDLNFWTLTPHWSI